MKIMCLIKITCPIKNGFAPLPFAPTIWDTWQDNFLKCSEPYIYNKDEVRKNDSMKHNTFLFFDSEEEINTWANNCRLTDPLLIADQETWETAHGITITYEYYSLSPIIGPDPIL